MKYYLAFILVLVLPQVGHGAILIEDEGRAVSKTSVSAAADGMSFRKQRRFGVGLSTAGALGLVGANLEINFTDQTSFLGGFGLGDSYQSFALQMKHSIGGRWFMPYVGGGYARWYTAGDKNGQLNKTNPSFLADRFLNNEEKSSGEFAENLIYPMAGVQYLQLSGNWAGVSAYAQILMLIDIDDLISAPTGEFGIFYYF